MVANESGTSMRRDLRGEAVTMHILLSLGKAALE
jgi:hypothetical protein